MLEKANARQLYDELVEAEVGDFLADTKEIFDLILAGDLLVYFGDLTPLLDAVGATLRSAGLFAFNVETTIGDFCCFGVRPLRPCRELHRGALALGL